MKELLRRTLTAAVLIGLVLLIFIFLPLTLISVVLFGVISLAVLEFVTLSGLKVRAPLLIILHGLLIAGWFTFRQPPLPLVIVLVIVTNGIFYLIAENLREGLDTFIRDISVQVFVVFYLYFPLFYILELVRLGQSRGHGSHYFFFLVAVIAVGDSGAFFLGRIAGKRRIYPVASPNKTLEGLVAAVITGALAGWGGTAVFNIGSVSASAGLLAGGVLALVSQISDPVESLFKRAAGKKDSGRILPGHGGILDRLDSYIFCAPLFYYMILYLWP